MRGNGSEISNHFTVWSRLLYFGYLYRYFVFYDPPYDTFVYFFSFHEMYFKI